MKNILYACIAFFFILGCSSTGPETSDVSITSETVFSGQRIFAQVISVTDNPPMTYQWTATGGVLDIPETAPFSTYWVAPEVPGSYTLTCTITDKEKKQVTHAFKVQVLRRILARNLISTGLQVLTITKESEYKLGGIWASVQDDKLRFFSSQYTQESVWSKNFYTMLNRTDPTTQVYTIWGVVEKPGNKIDVLTSTTDATLVCETCLNIGTITALAKDVSDSSILWVGTTSGLSYYTPSTSTSTTSTTSNWNTYFNTQVNDLSEGPDYVYAATSSGIYRTDGIKDPIYSGNTCAVLAIANGSATDVWSVVQGIVQKNGNQLDPQPPFAVCSLDIDPSGNIWCGKYWWDDSQWHVVPGLEAVSIVKSVASTEGLIYFLSDSGVLYRW